MKAILYLVLALAVAMLSAGCITVFVPVSTPTPAPTAIILPAVPPPTTPLIPSPTPIPTQLAPLCTVDPLADACAAPVPETLSKSCVNKIPYTLVALPPGSTFEVVDTGMTCRDEGIRGGKLNVSCTGGQLYSYNLKVCQSGCSESQLEVTTDQCEDGYGYNAAGGCCWPLSALEDAGCTLYRVDIGYCPP